MNIFNNKLLRAAGHLWRPLIVVSLLAGLVGGSTAVAPVETTAHAASNPIYWGSYVDGAPYDTTKLDQFETDAGKRESIDFWGEPWAMNGTMQKFQTSMAESVRLRGTIPMIGWTSWDTGAAGDKITQPNYTLASIYNGTYDAYITQWARDAKTWGHPFFLRFDHEMNGWWFPWSEGQNTNQAGDYVKAWRHVVDIFRSVGANNVTWVWCVNTTDPAGTALTDLYPGDNYVDWTQIDGYNWGTDHGSAWLTFDQVFGLNPWTNRNSYQDVISVASSKPMMIGETATSINGGDAAAWIKDAMQTQVPLNYPMLKGFVWFNWNAGDSTLDWPIETTQAQETAFQQSIGSAYYASNTFGSLPAGVIQPIGGAFVPPTPTPIPPTPTQTATSVPPTLTMTPTRTATAGSTTAVPVGPATITLKSNADTYVDATQPTSTLGGTSVMLQASNDTAGAAFLQFDLTGLAGKTLTFVQLNLLTDATGSAGSYNVKAVSDSTWTEQSVSYNTPIDPSAIGATLGIVSAPAGYTWYSVGLPASAIQAQVGGKVSFEIDTDTANVLSFSSRDQGSNGPQLMVGYQGLPTATATPTWSAPATATATATPLPPTTTPTPLRTATPASTTPVPVGPATIILHSNADTYVSAAQPASTSGGTSVMLQASNDTTGAAFLQFDLTGLAGKTLTFVQLNLKSNVAGSPGFYNIKSVSDSSWTEQSVSYNTPIDPSAIGATLGIVSAPAGYTWYSVGLPASAIQAQVGGKVSFEIDTDTANLLSFSSRDQGSNGPQLMVGYQGLPTATATPTWSAPATATATPTSLPPTITPTPLRTATPARSTPVPVGPANIILQSNADTYVDAAQPASTNGGTSVMLQASSDTAGAAFLQFDLTGLAGKTLTFVQLNLLTDATGSAGSYNVKAVSDSTWTEQTVSYNTSIASSAIGATLGSFAPSAGYTWYSVVLPVSAIQSQVGGKVSIEIDTDAANVLSFSSRDQGSNGPQLMVGYQGPPTATATPTWSAPATATPTATPLPPTITPTPLRTATPASFTPVPNGPTTIRVKTSADTYTDSAQPTSASGGTSVMLQASTDATGPAFLQFDLTGLAGKTLTFAQLNLLSGGAVSHGTYNIKYVSDSTWTEQSVTYSHSIAPSAIGATLASIAPSAGYTWYSAALPFSAIQPQLGSKISFEIDTTTANLLSFSSRDQGTNGPQLMLGYK